MAGLLNFEEGWTPYSSKRMVDDLTFGDSQMLHNPTVPDMTYPDGIWEQFNRGQEIEEEVKIEEQAGQPSKTTTTLKPAETKTKFPMSSFNPMEMWEKVSAIVDAEMMTQQEADKRARQYASETSSFAPGQEQGQEGYPNPFDQRRLNTGPQAPPGEINGPGVQPPAVHPNPFDPSRLQGPQGDVTGAAFNNPHLGGDPYVSAGAGYNPIEFPDVGVPQGPPPGQPPYDPTAGMGVPVEQAGIPGSGDMGPNPMGMMETEEEGLVNAEWVGLQERSGATPVEIKKSEATIATAALEATGNTVNGEDQSDDPIMNREWAGQMDPRKRQAEYLQQMNMIILGGIMLDIAANAMGVRSNASKYMDGQMQILQQRMKFDDQNRIYDATRRVYYPNGVYESPGNQQEVFEAFMSTGMVSPAEASAISGEHPSDPVGYDEYFVVNESGGIESVFVPKGHPPPPGSTGSATVAAANSPNSGTDPSAMRIEAEVNSLRKQADQAELAGDAAGAEKLRRRAEELLALGGGKSTRDEFNYTAARQTFSDIYGGKVRASAEFQSADNTFRNEQGEFIPWSAFRQKWLNSYKVKIMGSDGQIREEDGWLAIKANPTGEAATLQQGLEIPTAATYALLEENPTTEIIQAFIKRFGYEQLPEKFR